MSAEHAYALCGVELRSEIALTTLSSAEHAGAETVELSMRTTPLSREEWQPHHSIPFTDSERPFVTVYRTGEGYAVEAHGIATFAVHPDASRIECELASDEVGGLLLEQLVVDQVLPRMLHTLGRPCLHASAVDLGSGAVAFVGETGAGKSTLSAAACEGGAMLVCDDCLGSTATEDGIVAHRGYGSVRLWPDAAEALRDDADALPSATPRVHKKRAPYPMVRGDLPLAAVVRLRRGGDEATVVRLRGAESMRALGAHVHRMAEDDVRGMRREFEMLGLIAERVPIYELTVPRGHDALSGAVETLRRELRTTRR